VRLLVARQRRGARLRLRRVGRATARLLCQHRRQHKLRAKPSRPPDQHARAPAGLARRHCLSFGTQLIFPKLCVCLLYRGESPVDFRQLRL
jgi:hypothetical protein